MRSLYTDSNDDWTMTLYEVSGKSKINPLEEIYHILIAGCFSVLGGLCSWSLGSLSSCGSWNITNTISTKGLRKTDSLKD